MEEVTLYLSSLELAKMCLNFVRASQDVGEYLISLRARHDIEVIL